MEVEFPLSDIWALHRFLRRNQIKTPKSSDGSLLLKLNYLLAMVPLAIALDYLSVNPVLVFVVSALAVIPLAGLMGKATENLASYLGPTVGGLLNATFGNAPEIIISMMALSKGLVDVVKAAITGSLIGNLLLSLGLAIVFAATRNKRTTFNKTSASVSAGLLMVAGAALIVPALFHHTSRGITKAETFDLSLFVAIILLIIYVLNLVFTLVTDRNLFQEEPGKEDTENGSTEEESEWSRNMATGVLLTVTIILAIISEILTDALEPAIDMIGLTPIFAGVIVLAMVGNFSDILISIRFSLNNKLDLAFESITSASTQVALLVTPVLVLGGLVLGQPMNLLFTQFEVAAIVMAVLIVSHVSSDGECYWIEGIMLLGVYLILAVGFFFLPA